VTDLQKFSPQLARLPLQQVANSESAAVGWDRYRGNQL